MSRIAIVAVHGVIPQVRYGFQDDVATQLRIALDGDPKSNGPWQTSVVFPSPAIGIISGPSTDATDTPTITRVHRASELDADAPVGDFFDIHEAYWSPIDKGKTTAQSVLQWLLTTIFLPLNDTARYREHFLKVVWDVGFVLTSMILGVLCFLGCLMSAAWALAASASSLGPDIKRSPIDALGYLGNPLTILKGLNPSSIISLAAGFVGAYLAAQTIRALWSLAHNLRTLLSLDPVQLASRLFAIGLLTALAAGGIFYCVSVPTISGKPLSFSGLCLVVSVLLFQSGRVLLFWFLENFFGDVQIYTTRNENSEFFALRESILDLVTKTIISTAETKSGVAAYDRVYVMAHSLGSTIALDALMRIYNAKQAGTVSPAAWTRLRGFITFGTALEKTKYFFNAWSPTQSQAFEEWQDDLYGPLFTADISALSTLTNICGIYWLNCWYFSDFVSDGINSYRSYVLPNQSLSTRIVNRNRALRHATSKNVAVAGRLVAQNRSRFGDFEPWTFHFITHGDYLTDQKWFWTSPNPSSGPGVLDVITSCLPWGTIKTTTGITTCSNKPFDDTPLDHAADLFSRYTMKP